MTFIRQIASTLVIVGLLACANAQSATMSSFLDSVARRLDLSADQCPQALTDLFSSDATFICYRHTFQGFDTFMEHWERLAVWPGRFVQVGDWVEQQVPSGLVRYSAYALDYEGLLVMFAPGSPGPLMLIVNDPAAAKDSDVAPPVEARDDPARIFESIGALQYSRAIEAGQQYFTTLTRGCSRVDIACTSTHLRVTARTMMERLDMTSFGWRIQDIDGDTLYSTVVENLIVVIAESRSGSTLTVVRLDVGLEGFPKILGP